MADEQGVDVAESPAAPASPSATPPAAPNAGVPPADPEASVPFHRHPRWIERQRQFEELRSGVGQRDQTIAQLQRQVQELQRTASGPARSAEESFQRQQAQQALEDLVKDHPTLAPLIQLAKVAPQLVQGYQGVSEVARAQQDMQIRAARSHIADLAKTAGLVTDDKSLKYITRMVAMAAGELENGSDRFEQGDLSVLDEAWKEIEGFLGQFKRTATATVLDAKNKTAKLPPRPTGGGPAEDAPPELKAEDRGDTVKVRAYERSLGEQAKRLLAQKLRGA